MIEDRRPAVVIEDDADIRFLLETTLGQAGFEVHSAPTGIEGVELVRAVDPIVTTLDISLPDIDGFEVARRVRMFTSSYILMLTGRSDEIDTLLGLEAGADDYVTKPFRPREVRARIAAMLRRPRELPGSPESAGSAPVAGSSPVAASSPVAGSAAPAGVPLPDRGYAPTSVEPLRAQHGSGEIPVAAHGDLDGAPATPADGTPAVAPDAPGSRATDHGDQADGVLTHDGLVVDVDARLTTVDGRRVHLTRSEFDILATIVGAGRRVVEKDRLVRVLWGERDDFAATVMDADRRSVEVHMANLRRKLGDGASAPRFVETVRGVGYRLTVGR
ncbi:MAG: response regulator [Actinomycetaceae bacterium]